MDNGYTPEDGGFSISYLIVREDTPYDVKITNVYQQKGFFGLNITFEVDMHDPETNESGMHKFYLPKRPDPDGPLARYLKALVGEEKVKDNVGPADLTGLECRMKFLKKVSDRTNKTSFIPSHVEAEYTDGFVPLKG